MHGAKIWQVFLKKIFWCAMFGIFYIHVDYIHHKQLLNAFVCHMGVTYLDATHMFGHFFGGYHTFSAHHVYIVSPF
jgi:hypothetical protein